MICADFVDFQLFIELLICLVDWLKCFVELNQNRPSKIFLVFPSKFLRMYCPPTPPISWAAFSMYLGPVLSLYLGQINTWRGGTTSSAVSQIFRGRAHCCPVT